MRNVSTLKRMALAILFAGLFTSSYADAKKYYLSPEGSDDNDGLTEATAKASVSGVITEIYKKSDFGSRYNGAYTCGGLCRRNYRYY